MTPREILAEWSKGCSITQWENDPLICEPCNDAALDALRIAFYEEAELLCREEEKPHSASALEAASDEEET